MLRQIPPCSGPAPPKAPGRTRAVETPVDREQSHRLGHVAVHDLENPAAARSASNPSCDPSASIALRASSGRSSTSPPSLNIGSRRPSTTFASVGCCRLAPAPVAGGTRIRASALRPDLQDSSRVDPRHAPAAGADRSDVQHRRRNRDSELEVPRGGRGGSVIGDQASIEARAADVGRHQRIHLEEPAEVEAADHAAGRSLWIMVTGWFFALVVVMTPPLLRMISRPRAPSSSIRRSSDVRYSSMLGLR